MIPTRHFRVAIHCCALLLAGCSDDGTTTQAGGGGTTPDGAGGQGAALGGGGAVSTSSMSGAGGQGAGGAATTTGGGGAGSAQGGAAQGGAAQGGAAQGGAAQGGAGQGGAASGCVLPADCDDGLSCTLDDCNAGTCVNTPDDAACDDTLFCNGFALCAPSFGDPVTGCTLSSGSPCDDGVSCTVDACDEAADSCQHSPSAALCNDGFQCNGMETCDVLLDCQLGTPLSCDDGLACTADFCDAAADACAHTAQDALCSDNLLCTGVEVCDDVVGCLAGTPLVCNDGIGCTTNDACSEAAGGCVFTPNNAFCNDGAFCNGAETCSASLGCVSGAPPSCADGVSCTIDSCSSVANACVHTENDAFCNDGAFCNGDEACDVVLDCVTTGAVQCSGDGIACTVEACDEASNSCLSTASNGLCQAGEFCTPGTGCTAAPPCNVAGDCSDGDACNGIEQCLGFQMGIPNSGTCAPGQPVVCDDGVDCTVDSCNPASGQCSNTESDVFCDDGLGCNGVEVCDGTLDCVAGTPLVCDDGVACSQESCVEPGVCFVFYDDGFCQNADVCDGAEACTSAGCVAQPPLVCPDDGILCTAESCDSSLGCISTADNSLCPCGQSCDASAGGCGFFCQVAECNGHVYQCGDCTDNDGDCDIDSDDTQCLGACDNTEDSLFGGIPGQNNSPCKSDCYFDQDTGSGNDDCYWSHKCDPLEVAPSYPPEGSQCAYNPNSNIPGYGGSCAQAYVTQSQQCADYCGPLTPNGCDCFGCCEIPGAPTTVWLGSVVSNLGSCTLADAADPALCKPCTQVQACLNTCDPCEICIGQSTLPPGCTVQECDNALPCGQLGQDPCGDGFFCITGCCQPLPG